MKIRPAVLVLAALAESSAAQEAIGPADYPAIEASLARPTTQAADVPFRELWRNPGRHQGRIIRVEGRVRRIFRQDARGRFPALRETWIVSADGNPWCLLAPAGEGLEPGYDQEVRFEGTFLRLIRYHAADGERAAPLIAGPEPPTILRVQLAPPASGSATIEILVGLGLGIVVLLVLIARSTHPRRPTRPQGPPPEFEPSPQESESGHSPPARASGETA